MNTHTSHTQTQTRATKTKSYESYLQKSEVHRSHSTSRPRLDPSSMGRGIA